MKNSIFRFTTILSAIVLLGAFCQKTTETIVNVEINQNTSPSLLVPAPNSNVNEMVVVNEENENTNEVEVVNENVNEPLEQVNEPIEVNNQNTNIPVNQNKEEEEDKISSVVVTYNGTFFSPARVTVSSGGTVTFVNNSSRTMQVSSDNHPTHTKNPELGSGPFTASGASYTVTLNKVGTWGYHDHLNPAALGTVIVQ